MFLNARTTDVFKQTRSLSHTNSCITYGTPLLCVFFPPTRSRPGRTIYRTSKYSTSHPVWKAMEHGSICPCCMKTLPKETRASLGTNMSNQCFLAHAMHTGAQCSPPSFYSVDVLITKGPRRLAGMYNLWPSSHMSWRTAMTVPHPKIVNLLKI